MKKIFSILMAILILGSFSSCGKNSKDIAQVFTETVAFNEDEGYVLNGGISYGDTLSDVKSILEKSKYPLYENEKELVQTLKIEVEGITFEPTKTYYFDDEQGLNQVKIYFNEITDKNAEKVFINLQEKGEELFGQPTWDGSFYNTIIGIYSNTLTRADSIVKWIPEFTINYDNVFPDNSVKCENTVSFYTRKISKDFGLTIEFNKQDYDDVYRTK